MIEEISRLKGLNMNLEEEKERNVSLLEQFAQNKDFLFKKQHRIEKENHKLRAKMEEMSKDFRTLRTLNEKYEELINTNLNPSLIADTVKEVIQQETNNLAQVPYQRSPVEEIGFKSQNFDEKYDLDSLIFGNKSTSTFDLVSFIEKSTEIQASDLAPFSAEISIDTSDLLILKHKESQVGARLPKLKKIELTEEEGNEEAEKKEEEAERLREEEKNLYAFQNSSKNYKKKSNDYEGNNSDLFKRRGSSMEEQKKLYQRIQSIEENIVTNSNNSQFEIMTEGSQKEVLKGINFKKSSFMEGDEATRERPIIKKENLKKYSLVALNIKKNKAFFGKKREQKGKKIAVTGLEEEPELEILSEKDEHEQYAMQMRNIRNSLKTKGLPKYNVCFFKEKRNVLSYLKVKFKFKYL